MSFLPYPAYKDSGAEWLGGVPDHWVKTSIKHVVAINMGQSPSSDDCNIDGVGVPFLQGNGEFGLKYPTPKQYCPVARKVADAGDLLFSVRAPVGALNEADQVYGIGRGLCAVKASMKISKEFLWHFLSSSQSFLDSISTGSTFEAVSAEQVENIAMALPREIGEQTQIARFLDHETARIDALIEEQQRLIELLKEKRQALISHAVTKGLDPTVPMKDSDVEWLGEVPAHWICPAIKHTCSLIKDGTHLPPARVDDGVPLLSVRNIISGDFVRRSDDSEISNEDYLTLCRAFVPTAGDVLLAIVGATLGKTAVISEGLGEFHIQRSLAIFRADGDKVSSEWLSLIFQSAGFQSLLWEYAGFSAQPGIYLGTLSSFSIPLPSRDEQNQIVRQVKAELLPMSELIETAQETLSLSPEFNT